MNKTININLGGIFFHIDEIAYQNLKRYLDAIKRSLADDPQGQEEIMADIEARIAELLQEKIVNERQVVNANDIEEISKRMGQPEDYKVDDEIFEDEPKTKSTQNHTTIKKLFRDGDDKYLGGVCSGLAHYFGIEPIWVRIILIVLAIVWGVGFLIYPLLWILIPIAQTTTEKLQMKGEPVNISNIEKKIREELEEVGELVKDGVNNISEKVKNSNFKKKVNNKTGIDEIFETIGKIFTGIFKVLGKFIGALLVFVAAITIVGLIIGIFSWGSVEFLGFGDSLVHYPPFFEGSIIPSWLLMLFGFIAVGIPIFVLFMLGLHILSSNIKSLSKTTKLTLLGIWLIALFGLLFAAINHKTQTAYDGVNRKTETLNIIPADTLIVKMVDNEDLSFNDNLRRRYNKEIVYDKGVKKLYSNRLLLNIKKSERNTPTIKIRKESQGQNRLKANNTAKNISYNFNFNNKELLLDGYFLSNTKNNYKREAVDVTLHLPLNSIIYLDTSTKTFLKNIDNTLDKEEEELVNYYYKMTKNGIECLNCKNDSLKNTKKNSSVKEDNFKLKINDKGVKVDMDNGSNKTKIKIDENGVLID